mgnify:CR=1 FL=1
MGNVNSMGCAEPIPLKGEHTEVKFPSQVETEQSLIIIVVVVGYYCFIRIIIVGAGQARCPPFSFILHHVLVCYIKNSPFYTIKVWASKLRLLLLALFYRQFYKFSTSNFIKNVDFWLFLLLHHLFLVFGLNLAPLGPLGHFCGVLGRILVGSWSILVLSLSFLCLCALYKKT